MSVTYLSGGTISSLITTGVTSAANIACSNIQIDTPSPLDRISRAIGIISEAKRAISEVERATSLAAEAFNEGIRAAIAQYVDGEEWEVSEDFVVSLESLLMPMSSQPTE